MNVIKKKWWVMALVLICAVLFQYAFPPGVYVEAESLFPVIAAQAAQDVPTDVQVLQGGASGAGQLYSTEKDIGEALLKGIRNYNASISINVSLSPGSRDLEAHLIDTVQTAVSYVRKAAPEIFWIGYEGYSLQFSSERGTRNQGLLTVKFTYCYTSDQSDYIKQQIDEVVETIVTAAPSDKYQAAKYFHDWIVNQVDYDMKLVDMDNVGGYEYACNIDGVFLNRLAICEGYTKAYQMLCERAGIPCKVVFGTMNGENHGWNYVQLDGKWYLVDCTSDDPVGFGQNVLRWDYFLLGSGSTVNGLSVRSLYTEDNGEYPALAETAYVRRAA